MTAVQHYKECGMELWDLQSDPDFPMRPPRRKSLRHHTEAFQRLATVFAQNPAHAAQELVEMAVDCCGAHSSGISLEESDEFGNLQFRWIAIAGSFSRFRNGTTPRFFSPCGTTISLGRAQLYTVSKDYYDYLQIEAEPITDGILIPWNALSTRGTLWAVCHGAEPIFDYDDFVLLDGLANFAAVALRARSQAPVDDVNEKLDSASSNLPPLVP